MEKYTFEELIENADVLKSRKFSTVSFTIYKKRYFSSDFLWYIKKFKTDPFYFTFFDVHKDSDDDIEKIVIQGRTHKYETYKRNVNFKLVYEEGDWFFTCDSCLPLGDVCQLSSKWATDECPHVIDASDGSVYFDEIQYGFVHPDDV
jgi:hypothetical protein